MKFETSFLVKSSLESVSAFHSDTRALKTLTMPPLWLQLHQAEPLAEGSISRFTMWLGPIPLRWTAEHSQVDPLHGFTDTQTAGPLKYWRHTHTFTRVEPALTRVSEHIEYDVFPGLRGWLTRLLFNPLGLRVMFAYRAWATRRAVSRF